MKNTIDALRERCSVRRYERRAVEQQKLDLIYEAVRNTPTSYNGQQFSVISIRDQAMKEQIYEITAQKQIKTCSVFMLFCFDSHKIRVSAAAKGVEASGAESTIDGYTVGIIDASLAMMSAVAAAESLGLGSCCVGYARTANPRLISEILGLPEGVTIVCGLTIGYPSEAPDLKPKQPLPIVIHEEHYMGDEQMVPLLEAYDATVCEYNRNRSGDQTTNDWTSHIIDYQKGAMDRSIDGYLRDQLGLKF